MSDLLIVFLSGGIAGAIAGRLAASLFLGRQCSCGWRCATWHQMVHHVEMKHTHKE